MPIKAYKPVTNGRRNMTSLTFEEITAKKPEKSLVAKVGKNGGRNNQGVITINSLKQGTVIATEIATADEYILNDEEQEILLDYNTYKELTVENEHKRGDLTVYKVDADNNKIGIGGVEFALYSYEFDKITGYYKTDVNR